ncbi:hypothetical protein [Rhizobium sp. 2MFCol3.1]|uniref:hypothetical protein n=1 Tax=Rhizobium sp. 2MFCol3.1 TaxID=1246459 RepID=UPI0003613942|nr:hypothetical protein [Rhizobium sp. 2MFCol3.1]
MAGNFLTLAAHKNPGDPFIVLTTELYVDRIELADFLTEFDQARANDTPSPVCYSGHLLLPGDDVVISLETAKGLVLKINGCLADKDHPMAALVEEYGFYIRRALRRNRAADVVRREIIGRWHENGDAFAFEPYLVRTVFLDKPTVLNKYRYRIFPLDGYKLGDDFWLEFNSGDTGAQAKLVFETSTEMEINYDEIPKSMLTWMPVGVVWSPPKKSGYPVLVEYAVGKTERLRMREAKAAAAAGSV